jgi:membrane-bound ClpP family serine protease
MSNIPFNKKNYSWMLAGLLVIITGFIIMSLDKQEFGFGFLGLTLGPIVVVAGFVLEFVAILKKN